MAEHIAANQEFWLGLSIFIGLLLGVAIAFILILWDRRK